MKKFKLFVASVLTYLMAISLLPVNIFTTVANAAESEYNTLVKSDYYLRSNQQYGNKNLISYYNEKENKVIISKVDGGKETILKEVDGYQWASISKLDDNTAIIEYVKFAPEGKSIYAYEKYDLNKNVFVESDVNEWKEPESNYEYPIEDPVLDNSQIKTYIDIVNKSYNLNISIENMRREMVSGAPIIVYRDDVNEVVARVAEIHHNPEIVKYEFRVGEIGGGHRIFSGIIYGDYAYLSEKGDEVAANYDRHNNTVFISDKLDYDYEKGISKCKIIEIKDNKVLNEGVVEIEGNYFGYSTKIFNQNDKLFIHSQKKLNSYTVSNGIYNVESSIPLYAYSSSYNKYDNSYWYIESKDSLAYLGKAKDGKLSTVVKLNDNINPYSYNDIFVYNENNIIIDQYNSFIIVQKENKDVPNIPEEPSNPETPGENGNNNNVVIKPSEDKVVAEVSKINPNEKNEIKVNTEASAKKIDVTIKDIESLKNGTGSLNITVNNGVQLNLPLSIIDKNLLEGAKDVTIKVDILENSEILKDIKGINKVFDFNLVINKEDGSTFIHNFKEGQAEVTLNLTDKDLEGLNKNNLVVYYYNDAEKKFEAMETKVDGNKVIFKTPHFSKYVVSEKIETNKDESSLTDENSTGTNNTTETKNEAGKGQLPQTGSKVSNVTILALAMGIVAIGGVMYFRKRRHA